MDTNQIGVRYLPHSSHLQYFNRVLEMAIFLFIFLGNRTLEFLSISRNFSKFKEFEMFQGWIIRNFQQIGESMHFLKL